MNSVERVKSICKERKIPISKLEKDLGYANGYIGQLKRGVLPDDRLKAIANYLYISIGELINGEKSDISDNKYYINEETADVAQEIFENDKILFDTYRSVNKDKLIAYAKKLEELRKMEEGE